MPDEVIKLEPDELGDITEAERQQIQDQAYTQMESIFEQLQSEYFNRDLFMTLFSIFKQAHNDMALKQFVLDMPTDQFMQQYRPTILLFSQFLLLYMEKSLDIANKSDYLSGNIANIDNLSEVMIQLRKIQSDNFFLMPDIDKEKLRQ
jgi:hypothetical protein